jgi:hypothetical protein
MLSLMQTPATLILISRLLRSVYAYLYMLVAARLRPADQDVAGSSHPTQEVEVSMSPATTSAYSSSRSLLYLSPYSHYLRQQKYFFTMHGSLEEMRNVPTLIPVGLSHLLPRASACL